MSDELDRPKLAKTPQVSNVPYWHPSQPLSGESGKRLMLNDELNDVIERRKAAGTMTIDNSASKKESGDTADLQTSVRSSLVGLALSGGGIRSGAFSLGVLETLRKKGLMKFVDYLSTVSGGGYAGAFWSSNALASQGKKTIETESNGRISRRLLKFIHSGNYLAKTASFFNRYLPGLVLILTMCASGLIAGASLLAYLFRKLDQPYFSDAIAALGFDSDILRAIFPATFAFIVWSIAWLLSYWKYGHRLQATAAGVLLWPLVVCVLAAGGLLLGTGDIGLPFLQEQLMGVPGKPVEATTVPQPLWWLIVSVIGASLLPYFHIPTLVRSGLNPKGVLDKYTFRIASAALLVGVPFVAFALLARENVSKYLESRDPEIAEADLFGALSREQRTEVFKVMRLASERDMFESSGGVKANCKIREALQKHDAKESQIDDVLNFNLQFVNGSEADFKVVEKALQTFGLSEKAVQDVGSRIRDAWLDTRDMSAIGRTLKPFNFEAEQERIHEIAKLFLQDKITTAKELAEMIDAATKPGDDDAKKRRNEQAVDAIRSMWPPSTKVTNRRKALTNEIQPLIRSRESGEQASITDAVWRYGTDKQYLRRDLDAELAKQNLEKELQSSVYEVAKNYWPPRHHEILDRWELRFAEQAVLELPRSSERSADPLFAGRAIAHEKMSILQRFRYLMSFIFHWGLTPLVADEATGVEHNPLYRIWTVRQRRREIETEVVQRVNGQVLANPYFFELIDPDHQKVVESDRNGALRDTQCEKKADSKSVESTGFYTPESNKLLHSPESFLAAVRIARETSRRWLSEDEHFDNLKLSENLSDVLRDELKDETGTSIPLKRFEAAISVQREQLKQELIRANREMLEWYLAQSAGLDPTKPVSLRSKDRVFGRTVLKADQAFRLWFFWRAGLVFLVALFVIDMNSTSLHGFYRTQIARNWIEPMDGVGRELPLAQLDTTAHGSPYHLISTSLNLMGRRRKDRGDTQADHFLFSKLYCGSVPTGYVRTSWFAGGKYKLADAIAISGAAVSPAQNTGLLVRALLFLGNLRLGQWLPNPAHQSSLPYWMQKLLSPFWVTPARVAMQSLQLAETRQHVFVTDGGHHENLGIGPLLDRRCRLIIAFDAGADEGFDFVDLASLVRWAKLKHGVRIEPLSNQDMHDLMPTKPLDPELSSAALATVTSTAQPTVNQQATETMASENRTQASNQRRLAREHWIAAQIIYPSDQSGSAGESDQADQVGLLIYVKTSLTGEEPFEVLRYARINQHFPHDSTVDQLYDPDQFATYVQLGHHIAEEIHSVIREQPPRLWSQCKRNETAETKKQSLEFKKTMGEFLKGLS